MTTALQSRDPGPRDPSASGKVRRRRDTLMLCLGCAMVLAGCAKAPASSQAASVELAIADGRPSVVVKPGRLSVAVPSGWSPSYMRQDKGFFYCGFVNGRRRVSLRAVELRSRAPDDLLAYVRRVTPQLTAHEVVAVDGSSVVTLSHPDYVRTGKSLALVTAADRTVILVTIEVEDRGVRRRVDLATLARTFTTRLLGGDEPLAQSKGYWHVADLAHRGTYRIHVPAGHLVEDSWSAHGGGFLVRSIPVMGQPSDRLFVWFGGGRPPRCDGGVDGFVVDFLGTSCSMTLAREESEYHGWFGPPHTVSLLRARTTKRESGGNTRIVLTGDDEAALARLRDVLSTLEAVEPRGGNSGTPAPKPTTLVR